MMKIIKARGVETQTSYEHNFHWNDDPGAGYSFTVTKAGEYMGDNECGRKNYERCKSGEMVDKNGIAIIDDGISRRTWNYRTNAVGLCSCGEEVELYDQYLGACECQKCGSWYNLSGQELVHPKHWEDDRSYDYDF